MTNPSDMSNAELADALDKDCSYDLDDPIPHLREAASRLRAMEWQPIETAPKDGTTVLYLSPALGIWVGCEPEGYARGEWSRRGNSWCGQAFGDGDETHWCNLPPAPKGE